jgi:hypothetical protein
MASAAATKTCAREGLVETVDKDALRKVTGVICIIGAARSATPLPRIRVRSARRLKAEIL